MAMSTRRGQTVSITDRARAVFEEFERALSCVDFAYRSRIDRSSFTRAKLDLRRAERLYHIACAINQPRASRMWEEAKARSFASERSDDDPKEASSVRIHWVEPPIEFSKCGRSPRTIFAKTDKLSDVSCLRCLKIELKARAEFMTNEDERRAADQVADRIVKVQDDRCRPSR